MDVFATLVLLFVVSVQTYTLFDKVSTTYGQPTCRRSTCASRSGRSSRSHGSAIVAAVLLIAVRTYRLIFHPELMKPVDEASKSGE
jgi:hypothetical protein